MGRDRLSPPALELVARALCIPKAYHYKAESGAIYCFYCAVKAYNGNYIAGMTLDRFDRDILHQLQRQGRMSNQEVAEAVNLSPSPCLRRIRRLEEEGYIEGYVALLDARKLGLNLTAFIQISMDKHTPERFTEFDKIVTTLPEVLECHLITGQAADYLLKVIVEDMDAYQQFLLNKITRIEGVSGVHSSFVLRSPVKSAALPIP